MSRAAEKIEQLMTVHPKGFDLSLTRINSLLAALGSPHENLPSVIHVAGTNGKGSTIAFMRSILEAEGLAVHVHTSPHLVNWHERFRLGRSGKPGQLVDDETLVAALDRVAEANKEEAITVFEMLTASMFLLFCEHPADVCLVEVGLGGRLDATNVIAKPAVSVITPISFDHEAYLGGTLVEIAHAKAGIIKQEAPVISGMQDKAALSVIEREAAWHKAPLATLGEHFSWARDGGRWVFQDETNLMDLPLPSLVGPHQLENAATALAALKAFEQQSGRTISPESYEQGLTQAHWPGRMQRLKAGTILQRLGPNSEIWLDGGHNPGAAKAIAAHFSELQSRDNRPFHIICGMLTTKEPKAYFDYFKDLSPTITCVPITSSDAGFGAEELATIATGCGLQASYTHSLSDAIDGLQDHQCRALIAGSLYLVGDALALNGTPPE